MPVSMSRLDPTRRAPASVRSMALAGLTVVAVVVAGCGLAAGTGALSSCRQEFSKARCERLADVAAADLQVDRAAVVSVEIIPPPTPQEVDGHQILMMYGGATPIHVQLTLKDGSTRDTFLCGGVPDGPACTDDPHLHNVSPTGPGSGYTDFPEHATPMPTIDPATATRASTLHLDVVALPTAVGHHEVEIGQASLPNGILKTAVFDFVDPWPAGLRLADDQVVLEVRSTAPDGRPFQNVYLHGWREGVEPVDVVMVYDVDQADPAATLTIKDVTVG